MVKELLTFDEIQVIEKAFYDRYSGKGLSPTEVKELHAAEFFEDVCKAQLSKLQQARPTEQVREKIKNIVRDFYLNTECEELDYKQLYLMNHPNAKAIPMTEIFEPLVEKCADQILQLLPFPDEQAIKAKTRQDEKDAEITKLKADQQARVEGIFMDIENMLDLYENESGWISISNHANYSDWQALRKREVVK